MSDLELTQTGIAEADRHLLDGSAALYAAQGSQTRFEELTSLLGDLVPELTEMANRVYDMNAITGEYANGANGKLHAAGNELHSLGNSQNDDLHAAIRHTAAAEHHAQGSEHSVESGVASQTARILEIIKLAGLIATETSKLTEESAITRLAINMARRETDTAHTAALSYHDTVDGVGGSHPL
jgi:hypothetical protein